MKIKRIPAIILAAAMLGTMPIVPPETGLSLSTVAYAAEKLNAPRRTKLFLDNYNII